MTVSLDFIAAQLQRVLEGQSRIEQRLVSLEGRIASLEAKMDQHNDEMTVLTGMVLRYGGEHIAWGGMERQIRKINQRLEVLEGKT